MGWTDQTEIGFSLLQLWAVEWGLFLGFKRQGDRMPEHKLTLPVRLLLGITAKPTGECSSSEHSGTLMGVCANHTPFHTEAGSSWFLESVQLFSKVNINSFFNSAWGLSQTCGEVRIHKWFNSCICIAGYCIFKIWPPVVKLKQSTIRLRDLEES